LPRSGAPIPFANSEARNGEYASHSHNGYLDTVVAMGLPGLALLIAGMVIAPLRISIPPTRGQQRPRRCCCCGSAVRPLSLVAGELLPRPCRSVWFTFLLAVFGLHYLARFRVRE